MVTNIINKPKDEFIYELSQFIVKWMNRGEDISIGGRMYGVHGSPVVAIMVEGVKVVKLDDGMCKLERQEKE